LLDADQSLAEEAVA